MRWVAKSIRGNFYNQPEGFRALYAIENSFFVCECPVAPNATFVKEFPERYHNTNILYEVQNGKRVFLSLDPAHGIKLSEDTDKKYRRAVQYTPEQIALRLELIKWITLNIFLPDKQRLLNIDPAEVERITQEVESFDDDRLLKDYVRDNLMYDC